MFTNNVVWLMLCGSQAYVFRKFGWGLTSVIIWCMKTCHPIDEWIRSDQMNYNSKWRARSAVANVVKLADESIPLENVLNTFMLWTMIGRWLASKTHYDINTYLPHVAYTLHVSKDRFLYNCVIFQICFFPFGISNGACISLLERTLGCERDQSEERGCICKKFCSKVSKPSI